MNRAAAHRGDLFSRAGRWLRWRVGGRLSRLGEVVGSHALTYNRLHFCSFHEQGLENAPTVMAAISEVFPAAKRLIDIGAGSGAFAREAARCGLSVVALEHSAAGRRLGARMGVDIRPFDLSAEPPAAELGEFDLAYCFEVAEHLSPSLGERLVVFAAAKAPVVVFSAAHPGQTGTGHINEQPKDYWIERFGRAGMVSCESQSKRLAALFEAGKAAPWFHRNVIVFTRRSAG